MGQAWDQCELYMSGVSARYTMGSVCLRYYTVTLPHHVYIPLQRMHAPASKAFRTSTLCRTLATDPSLRYIKTAMTKVYTENAEYTKYIIDRTPAGRWGLPEDFRGAVIFLASRASDFCCGMSLVVDGGMIAK